MLGLQVYHIQRKNPIVLVEVRDRVRSKEFKTKACKHDTLRSEAWTLFMFEVWCCSSSRQMSPIVYGRGQGLFEFTGSEAMKNKWKLLVNAIVHDANDGSFLHLIQVCHIDKKDSVVG